MQTGSVKITFEIHLAEQTTVLWETVVVDQNLYLYIKGNLPRGCKEAFVSLLEYAEEILHCESVIVCFKKNRSDRAMMIRTFMFLGFHAIPPGNEKAPLNELFYLMYEID